MNELFGIPVDTLLVVLLVLLGAAAGLAVGLALRNPVLVKLGVRNVGRRRARTTLIVLGLMLGTAIIAAALATGDTMSHTIRSTTVQALGQTDELVSAKGADVQVGTALGAATGLRYFPEDHLKVIDAVLADVKLTDGVAPAIIEPVAVQLPARRQNEPNVALFATDPARMAGFGAIERVGGGTVTLAQLAPTELYLNEKAADELGAQVGDRVLVFGGRRPAPFRVRDIVRYDGAGTSDSGLLLPLDSAQRLLGKEGLIKHILISNKGGAMSGVGLTDQVVNRMAPSIDWLGLETDPSKQDALESADAAGSAFMAMFTTFGSFSIVAGILLIFLVFVMLAAERRGELGIARAVGTRRGHLVQLFVFEGIAYDTVAALVGAVLGAIVAYGMVIVMAGALDEVGFDIQYAVRFRSLAVAVAIGLLLTLVVVAVSAWRVSVMTISAAIRNLPEPKAPKRRRRFVLSSLGLVFGLLLVMSGASSGQATPLMLGVSLAVISVIPLLRVAGVSERLAYTGCGLVLVVTLMLPWRAWEAVFGELSMNFSTWIVSGLMIVLGAVWVIIFNADLVLRGTMRLLGRLGRLAPVLRVAMAYPLASRFRTGTTLAMFTLVVFTLVTGTASSGSFMSAFENSDEFSGGFQVRASTSAVSPIDDMRAALVRTPGIRPSDFRTIGSESFLPVDARQIGTGPQTEPYVVRGLDEEYLRHTSLGLGAIANGYVSAREVWASISLRPGLAVIDSLAVPRRDNFNFEQPTDFKLRGFFYEDGRFDPIPVEVRDPQTGQRLRLTVIGVLKDTAAQATALSTSQRTLAAAYPGRVRPLIHYFELAPGVDAKAAARQLESAFVSNGMEAQSLEELQKDSVAANVTFNRLIEGFMGLGLIVGVAALGVISARSVVERRQQIGVMRAIGFRSGMVQAAFLLESSFIALTSIIVGTALGLVLAYNIVDDSRRQASWENLTLVVPWWSLGIIFLVVYATALAATLAPALRASRIRPAEALRYQ
jgi:putative ABC transport system permease protein